MHPTKTRNQFLRLRVGGLSLARISRQLGVSKPTLIAWNRQARTEIAARTLENHQNLHQELSASTTQQLADLNRKLNALRQELFSRGLREVSTPALETLAGGLRLRIQQLESAINPQPGSACTANVSPATSTPEPSASSPGGPARPGASEEDGSSACGGTPPVGVAGSLPPSPPLEESRESSGEMN